MISACKFDGCSVAETGVCALERDPATCDYRSLGIQVDALASAEAGASSADNHAAGAPVLAAPERTANFPSSHTLGPDAVSSLMASRYVTVVGILGEPNSGKTACLASIYLLVANAMLKNWAFADSKSLLAFEDISRGARDWNQGSPPDQMTTHTEMMDDRRAGFLHLRLARKSDGRCVDLALPDLPGEWTTKLVTSAQSERFDFLKAADVLWIVLDGRTLRDRERRQGLVARLGQLGGRLKTMLAAHTPRVILVVTHRDSGEIAATVSIQLVREMKRREIEVTVLQIAPFSDNEEVRAGHGLHELIDATVNSGRSAPDFWPRTVPSESSRSFIGYRSDQ